MLLWKPSETRASQPVFFSFVGCANVSIKVVYYESITMRTSNLIGSLFKFNGTLGNLLTLRQYLGFHPSLTFTNLTCWPYLTKCPSPTRGLNGSPSHAKRPICQMPSTKVTKFIQQIITVFPQIIITLLLNLISGHICRNN